MQKARTHKGQRFVSTILFCTDQPTRTAAPSSRLGCLHCLSAIPQFTTSWTISGSTALAKILQCLSALPPLTTRSFRGRASFRFLSLQCLSAFPSSRHREHAACRGCCEVSNAFRRFPVHHETHHSYDRRRRRVSNAFRRFPGSPPK